MKAAVLKAFGSPLSVEDIPEPELGTGEVIVDVVATPMLAYAGEVYSGARSYPMELPIVLGSGCIGRVRAFGPDATQLAIDDWVYCDPTVRSRDAIQTPDIILQGLIAPGDAGLRLHRYFHDGGFAEQMRVPTVNAVRIGPIAPSEAARWSALGALLVPYGGLLAADLRAGEVVVVNGATGRFGGAGVAVALGMGAACVIATGRNTEALADLTRRFGDRVRTVEMLGPEAEDRTRILRAAPGAIDVVLDLLPPAASIAQVRTAVMAVRAGGRVALMGGVGMAGGPGLDLPYPWLMRNNITVRGQWMYARDAVVRMVALVRAGLIDLQQFTATEFRLEDVNAAVDHAAANAGPFRTTLVCP